MTKVLNATMPDGSVYEIPLDVILDRHARFCAPDFDGDQDLARTEITDQTLGKDMDAVVLFARDLPWSDVRDHARLVSPPTKDRSQDWRAATLVTIDHRLPPDSTTT